MKLNGYRASHRNRWHLLTEKTLSKEAFLLLEYYGDIIQFNPTSEHYGTFEYYSDEVALVFGCGEETIKRWHKELVEAGMLGAGTKRNRLRLIPAHKYTSLGAPAVAKEEKNKSVPEVLKTFVTNKQRSQQNPQINVSTDSSTSGKKPPIYKIPYKVDSQFPSSIGDRGEYELRRIDNPGLPSYEDAILIEESLNESL